MSLKPLRLLVDGDVSFTSVVVLLRGCDLSTAQSICKEDVC